MQRDSSSTGALKLIQLIHEKDFNTGQLWRHAVDFLGLVEVRIVELVNGLRKKGSTSNGEKRNIGRVLRILCKFGCGIRLFPEKSNTVHSATVDSDYITTRVIEQKNLWINKRHSEDYGQFTNVCNITYGQHPIFCIKPWSQPNKRVKP